MITVQCKLICLWNGMWMVTVLAHKTVTFSNWKQRKPMRWCRLDKHKKWKKQFFLHTNKKEIQAWTLPSVRFGSIELLMQLCGDCCWFFCFVFDDMAKCGCGQWERIYKCLFFLSSLPVNCTFLRPKTSSYLFQKDQLAAGNFKHVTARFNLHAAIFFFFSSPVNMLNLFGRSLSNFQQKKNELKVDCIFNFYWPKTWRGNFYIVNERIRDERQKEVRRKRKKRKEKERKNSKRST